MGLKTNIIRGVRASVGVRVGLKDGRGRVGEGDRVVGASGRGVVCGGEVGSSVSVEGGPGGRPAWRLQVRGEGR